MRRFVLATLVALAAVAIGVAGEATVAGLLAIPRPLVVLARAVPLPVAAPGAVSLGMSAFTMVVLKRETELPLLISGMIVPVVVFAGFGLAVLVHRFTALSLVEAAVGFGIALFLLVFVKQMVDPEP